MSLTGLASTLIFVWLTKGGTIAFTDDPRQIPMQYRPVAEAVEAEPLEDWEKFTPADQHDLPR